ncbi:hypothetical protein OsI_16044 [Oryza sativa Indica Group]|uniref:Methyltransferase type 11 domain-containing protein n=1 Tax=Oryza sativa subsp. indica TaxID=39946 RepID=A2XTW5_ORYSI|nr:hypothetical protein OsI_16044 [Oryza sativa Indica Group]
MHTSTKLRIPTSQQQQLDAAIMDGAHRSPAARPPAPPRSKMKLLLLVIATNLVSVYLFSGASLSLRLPAGAAAPSIHLWDSSALLRDLGATRAALAAARAEVAALRAQCNASSLLLESVLAGLGAAHGDKPAAADRGFDGWPEEPTGELRLATEPHRLPLGFSAKLGTDELHPGVGFACRNFQDELARYMAYDAGGECPDDADALELQLILKGIDGVLASRAPGTVRVGLDIGGGAGTFAARMRERGVTVVTTTLDVGAPFSAFVASRGLVPLQLSLAQRLPLADGVMDIVHAMQLGGWVPGAVLELALFDVYRVLRPGGVFWLDHFACVGPRLNDTYAPILDRVGFRRLRWKASRKLDLGAERNEWYLSALLEKPLT